VKVSQSHIFVTIPRLRPDVPATLAMLPREAGPSKSPKLQPYPSWAWQHGHHDQCASLVSVFRSRLDPCGRLWVLDTGSVNALEDFEQLCPPKLVVFNADGSESFRVEVPHELLQPDSMLVALALDMQGPERLQACPQMKDAVVYISDVIPGIIVFDLASQTFWRHEDPSMSPDAAHASLSIKGTFVILSLYKGS
jgi:Major royal jelly protein